MRCNVANYALLRCKIFNMKIRECKFFDKYHVFGWSSLVKGLLRATSVLTEHWCLAANLRIAIFREKWFSTDYSSTVGWILMILAYSGAPRLA